MRRLLVMTSLALAGFHTPASYDATATDGGGNRMYFDGSPRHKGYDCTACHTDAPHTITAQIDGAPEGAYTPGKTYTLTITLVGEHAGLGANNNQNAFVAEFIDDSNTIAGAIASADDKVALVDDGHVVAGGGKNVKTWNFAWTAPAAGAGAVTMYIGLVDGNGADVASVPTTDPGGDDVATSVLRACEATTGCGDRPALEPTTSKAAGCSATGGSGSLIAIAIALLLVVRRRRLLPFVLLAGCFDPTTPGECPDHVCGTNTTDGGSSCKENWVCTSWTAPANSDQATRACVDQNSAGTTECMPATSATLPALDIDYYKCNVHPIWQRGCGMLACHGNETDHTFRLYTRGRYRNKEQVASTCLQPGPTVDLQAYGTGTIMCQGWYAHTATEWKRNFDSSRSFMLDVTNADDSLLLREATKGGLPHAGVKLFTAGDADYTTVRNWLGGAKLGTTCNVRSN